MSEELYETREEALEALRGEANAARRSLEREGLSEVEPRRFVHPNGRVVVMEGITTPVVSTQRKRNRGFRKVDHGWTMKLTFSGADGVQISYDYNDDDDF